MAVKGCLLPEKFGRRYKLLGLLVLLALVAGFFPAPPAEAMGSISISGNLSVSNRYIDINYSSSGINSTIYFYIFEGNVQRQIAQASPGSGTIRYTFDALSYATFYAAAVDTAGNSVTSNTLGPYLVGPGYSGGGGSGGGSSGGGGTQPSDNTPPTTTISLEGTQGSNGWYVSNVQVALTASDSGGSGVKSTEYSFDGSTWITYTGPFTISEEGTKTVYYRSTDNAGNVERAQGGTFDIVSDANTMWSQNVYAFDVVSDAGTMWSRDGSSWQPGVPCNVESGWPRISGATYIWVSPSITSMDQFGPFKFRKTFNVPDNAINPRATIQLNADDKETLWVNGVYYGSDSVWNTLRTCDVSLKTGENEIIIEAQNFNSVLNPAGLIFKATVSYGVSEHPSVPCYVHPSWPRIDGATYIWMTDKIDSREECGPFNFRRMFDVPAGAANPKATIQINADDGETLWVNGSQVGSDNVWDRLKTYTVDLRNGRNEILIEAYNGTFSFDPYSNPGGLIYKASVSCDLWKSQTVKIDKSIPWIESVKIDGVHVAGNSRPVASSGGANVSDDFSSDSGVWSRDGSARLDGGNMLLTPSEGSKVGRILLNRDVTGPFVAEFDYRMANPGNGGADGMVFMFYKDKNYAPSGGGGLGFNASGGYGIEFDGYSNPDQGDPNSNHVALIQRDTSHHLSTCSSLPYSRYDGRWHHAKVTVDGGSVTVDVDGTRVLSWTGGLDRSYGGIGFAAATGGAWADHRIDNVVIRTPDTSPPSIDMLVGMPTADGKNINIQVVASDDVTVKEKLLARYSTDNKSTWSNWLTLNQIQQQAVPLKDQGTTAYVQVKDESGNVAEASTSAGLQLQGKVRLSAVVSDQVSGVGSVRFRYSTDGNTWHDIGVAQTAGDKRFTTPDVEWDTTVIPPGGAYLLLAAAADVAGNEAKSPAWGVKIGRLPETSILLEGTRGKDGWYRSPVKVTLTATDYSGTGIQKTEYKIGDAASWITKSNTGNSNPFINTFTVGDEGSRTLYARSTDNAGNVEPTRSQEVKIDTTPPVTEIDSNKDPGNEHLISVTFSATDPQREGVNSVSGVDYTEYIIYSTRDGKSWDDTGWQRYDGLFTLDDTGLMAVVVGYRSADRAGNLEEPKYAGTSQLPPPWLAVTEPKNYVAKYGEATVQVCGYVERLPFAPGAIALIIKNETTGDVYTPEVDQDTGYFSQKVLLKRPQGELQVENIITIMAVGPGGYTPAERRVIVH